MSPIIRPAVPNGTISILILSLAMFGSGCTRSPETEPGAAVSPGDSSAETAMFRETPVHTGVVDAGPDIPFSGLAWTLKTDGAFIGSPVIHDETVVAASGNGAVFSIDRRSGEVRWRYDAGSPIGATPAVADGRVFCATRDGRIFALDAETGSRLWTFQTGPEIPFPWGYESGDIYLSSPTPDGEDILIGAGDGFLYRLRARSGEVVWKAATDGRIRSTPAVMDDKIFVGSADGHVYSFDRSDGSEIWRYATLGSTLDSGNFGYDRRTVQSSPAIAHGAVFVGARDGFLYALDKETGRERWTFDHEISWVNSSPAVIDSLVIAGSSDGQFIHAVGALDGVERWRTKTPGIAWSSPVVAGDNVFTGTGSGVLLVLDLQSGEEKARYRTDGPLLSTPAVDSNLVIAGTMNGRLYAIRADAQPIRRAVFHDDSLEESQTNRAHERIRDFFDSRGYEPIDLAGLREFLSGDGRSTIVFAMDYISKADGTALRDYLDRGGKVLWIGLPPHIFMPEDPENASLLDYDRPAVENLLGVSHRTANFDRTLTRATPEGRQWGLNGAWRSAWAVPADAPDAVLSTDDLGYATSWAESYGGEPGTGFIRVDYDGPGDLPDHFLLDLHVVAEYRPVP